MRTRKGISPVIATIIIVAVAIAISIAVAGWLFHLWGGLAGGPRISVSAVHVYSDGTVEFYVANNGTVSDKLVSITLATPTGTYSVTSVTVDSTSENLPITIEPNKYYKISGKASVTLNSGQAVTLTIDFEKSGSYKYTVVVEPAASSGTGQ